jgi:TM2 domain-containing membrane protein YozV
LLVSNYLSDARAIEQRMLDLAYTTDAKITAPALAYYAPCTIDDAAGVLENLASRGRVSMEVEDDGSIVYELLGRQKLTPRATHAALAPVTPRAIARPYREPRHASPLVAAALSMFVPGAGHLYAGRVFAAFLWFLVVGAGYALILPGLVLHLFSIVSAAAAANRLGPAPRHLLAAAM